MNCLKSKKTKFYDLRDNGLMYADAFHKPKTNAITLIRELSFSYRAANIWNEQDKNARIEDVVNECLRGESFVCYVICAQN
jgi:hypothetical protein